MNLLILKNGNARTEPLLIKQRQSSEATKKILVAQICKVLSHCRNKRSFYNIISLYLFVDKAFP
jgi:hypothetical protein